MVEAKELVYEWTNEQWILVSETWYKDLNNAKEQYESRISNMLGNQHVTIEEIGTISDAFIIRDCWGHPWKMTTLVSVEVY